MNLNEIDAAIAIPSRRPIANLFLAICGIVLFFSLVSGWYSARSVRQVAAFTDDLYAHPFAVSNAALEMKATLYQLRNHMLSIAMLHDQRDDPMLQSIKEHELAQASRADLAIIKKNFLGDMERVKQLEIKLDQWDLIRADILAAVRTGDISGARGLVRTVGTPKFDELVPLLDYITGFARNKARQFVAESDSQATAIVTKALTLRFIFTLLLLALIFLMFRWARFLEKELVRQATTDLLTGIPNRRHFLEFLDQEIARTRRSKNSFALAMVDLDLFKSINDRYGHAAGDLVLKQFCAICRENLRDSDIVGRTGGEEFAILFPDTGLTDAQEVLERLRKSVASNEAVKHQSIAVRFTASFGLAASDTDECDSTAIFKRADMALYAAKEGGRNRVCVHAGPTT